MCGRIARTSPRPAIAAEFGVHHFVNVDLSPRYNIAPSQYVEAIAPAADELRVGLMKWGFVGAAGAPAPINARAETVAASRMFAEAFTRRRCLVVADGFYEWRREGKTKRPYFIHLRSRQPFGLAAVWTPQRQASGATLPTCAILTCAPNALMAPIHNRMPVIVPAAARVQWLDRSTSTAELRDVMVPLAADLMEACEVSTYVNSPHNDSAECMRPL